jgi:DNA adenine methylase
MFKETVEASQTIDANVNWTSNYASHRRKPFLKWVGGKKQLIPQLLNFIPESFNKYIEPFVGGGALFFELSHSKSVISDSNEELIITYQAVRDDVMGVISALESFSNDEQYYYLMRALDPFKLSKVERAARLIFLNKTCFNGLYRVNKKGQFNVPYNKAVGKNFLDRETLIGASKILEYAKIVPGDYKSILTRYARKGDFVFLDPPYQPIAKYSDFKRYTKKFFYEKDQVELAEDFKRLIDRGCKVILTNSAHPIIFDLYKNFEIRVIPSKRLVSCNPETRTGEDIIVLGGV